MDYDTTYTFTQCGLHNINLNEVQTQNILKFRRLYNTLTSEYFILYSLVIKGWCI